MAFSDAVWRDEVEEASGRSSHPQGPGFCSLLRRGCRDAPKVTFMFTSHVASSATWSLKAFFSPYRESARVLEEATSAWRGEA
jgi:hypothetical protein